ncbi:YihY/virulence factor BrkB family protein [Corynebacterium cystitidis]|uniref:YihY/virulence factor BrkB family protein n=1 Tax=Corynebacterium cystitidis TaxID=35757 RepID=UPI00211DD93E|nr:YihY/virulence factor BrkB family protein [Corynebacterium cystitidis]
MDEQPDSTHLSPDSKGTSTAADFIVPLGGSHAQPLTHGTKPRNPLERGNRITRKGWKLILRRTWSDFFLDALMDRGAVLTFFMLLTFAPTVLAAYSVATLVLARNEAEVTQLTEELIAGYVPEEIADTVRNAVNAVVGSTAQGTAALIFSIVFSLLSSSAYARAFARSANTVYGRVEGRTVVPTWLTMWGLTIIIVIGGVFMLGAFLLRESIVVNVLEPVAEPLGLTGTVDYLVSIFLPVWQWLRFPVIALVGMILIANLYYFAPNVRPQKFRWLTFGSATTLVMIGLVWWLFGQYLSLFAGASTYGVLGTAVAALIALWVMNIVLILGVKIDAEILRVKELQQGYASERTIQAPPRSSKAALKYATTQQNLEAAAREIKKDARVDE